MADPRFIDIRGLHMHYVDGEGNDLHILRGVDLAVARGETVSIMGASGAGKSTLLHLVGALDQPAAGSIRIDGADLARMDADAVARFRNGTIGFVFQFHHLLMDFNALENVMMPMWIRAGRTLPLHGRARELLAEVGLAARASHKPAQLSGGEQQRLAIARAIANDPKILLADEPTGNLDQRTGGQVGDLLLRLNAERNLTLILVTHNPDFAARMNRRYELADGRLHSHPTSPRHA